MWECVSSPSELDVDLTILRSEISDVNPNFLRSRPCLCHFLTYGEIDFIIHHIQGC